MEAARLGCLEEVGRGTIGRGRAGREGGFILHQRKLFKITLLFQRAEHECDGEET